MSYGDQILGIPPDIKRNRKVTRRKEWIWATRWQEGEKMWGVTVLKIHSCPDNKSITRFLGEVPDMWGGGERESKREEKTTKRETKKEQGDEREKQQRK